MRRRNKRKPSLAKGLVFAPWWLNVLFATGTWFVGRLFAGFLGSVQMLEPLVPLVETFTLIGVFGFLLIALITFFTRKVRTAVGLGLSGVKLVDDFRKAHTLATAASHAPRTNDPGNVDGRREPYIAPVTDEKPSYKVRDGGLLTTSEIAFYRALERAVGHQFRILSMVRVGDALYPNQARFSKGWGSALSRVNQKHFDFVLCDWESFELVAAIELDDPTHFKASRKKRDEFLNKTCKDAGLPLIRFWVADKNTPQTICDTINKVLGTSISKRPREVVKYCARCDAPMLCYRGTSGALAGKRFWRCARYPICREVVPIEAGRVVEPNN